MDNTLSSKTYISSQIQSYAHSEFAYPNNYQFSIVHCQFLKHLEFAYANNFQFSIVNYQLSIN